MDLKTAGDKVAWLMQNVPATQSNYTLLILLYWQVFDEIDISTETINQIIEHGTEPETISRAKRKVVESSFNAHQLLEDLRAAFKENKG